MNIRHFPRSRYTIAIFFAGAVLGFFRPVLPGTAVWGVEPALIQASGGQVHLAGQSFAPDNVVLISGGAGDFFQPNPQAAVVVGPAAEGIFTDKYGRIKVQFHSDRRGR